MNYQQRKKIVVVGASGFCGRSMVKLLDQEGYKILNLDIRAPRKLYKSEEFQQVDIIDENRLTEKFNGAEAVINLAGRQFATPPKPPRFRTLEFFSQLPPPKAVAW